MATEIEQTIGMYVSTGQARPALTRENVKALAADHPHWSIFRLVKLGLLLTSADKSMKIG